MIANYILKTIAAALLIAGVAAFAVSCGGDDDDDAPTPTPEATPTPMATVQPVTLGDLTIKAPFSRAALDRGGVFFTVENAGSEDDALIGASSDAAGKVELHETVTEGASTMMRPIERIEIPAGGTATLKPGGLHVMLTELTRGLQMGDTFTLTLEFEKAGSVDIEATVTAYTEETMGSDDMGTGSATPMQ